MINKTNTYKKILNLFYQNRVLWATDIAWILSVSRVMVHKTLKILIEDKKIEKIGLWSHVRYKSLVFIWKNNDNDISSSDEINIKSDNNSKKFEFLIDFKTKKFLDEHFYKFDSDWKILIWYEWFVNWVKDRKFDFEKSLNNYKKIVNYVENLENNCWLLDASDIFTKKFDKNYMQKVFYAGEYSFMEFGRSKLAEMTFYAKQSQNSKLINQWIDEIFYKLECLIKNQKIDCIAITPWSIDRKNQLLWILKARLWVFNFPFLNIVKYYENGIPIPQKSIKSKEGRIKNATNTIFVDDKNIHKYKNILLIDDFVWSWATLNITAKKIIEAWWKMVTWFAFVWSMDLTYEVINEI